MEIYESHDLTFIGGDFHASDSNGHFYHTLATLFPRHRLMVIARGGIHGDLINTACAYIKQCFPEKKEADLIEALCANAISLNLSKTSVIVRMEPGRIALILEGDELLQRLVPKSRIRFTGLHLPEVRNALDQRGEIWRMVPAPIMENDFSRLIRHSRVSVGAGIMYLYNGHTGEHILTYQEFIRIRPLIRLDIEEAMARLREIVDLYCRCNRQGYSELAFLVPAEHHLEIGILHEILTVLEADGAIPGADAAERLFDRFAEKFRALAGVELTEDSARSPQWRAAALSRLFNIDEKITAEWALGLGKEFYLNVQWLPGARIEESQIIYDSDASSRVKSLISYYCMGHTGVTSINVGRILTPLTRRKPSGEEREVYIISLGLADGRKSVRHVRMSKWDVAHRLKKGIPLEQAIHETRGYREYIIDRLTAAYALKLPVPEFKEIFVEEAYGDNAIPVFYFERQYIPGIVSCGIPSVFYSRKGFLVRLAGLLGAAAAASMVLGRKEPGYPTLFFDDGDEVIQLDDAGLPERLIMIETTGSFADWTTPLPDMTPYCLRRLAGHMETARRQGVEESELLTSQELFVDGLISEIRRMQELLTSPGSSLPVLFSDCSSESGGIRNRWEGILHRLRHTDLLKLKGELESCGMLPLE